MTSLKGSALLLLRNLLPSTRQDYKELVAALESRMSLVHQQELHRSRFKSRLRRRGKSLQELEGGLEHLVTVVYPLAPKEMKNLLAKEQFIDAVLDCDARRRLKQGRPLEPYRLASLQRELHVCGMAEETPAGKTNSRESGQDDL